MNAPSRTPELASQPQRVLVLDWHDGPLEGIAEYGRGVYLFLVVGDPLGEIRRFLLREVNPDAIERLAAAFQAVGSPIWPLWRPMWSDLTADALEHIRDVIASVSGRANPIVAIVEADGIREKVARKYEVVLKSERDWMESALIDDRYGDAWDLFFEAHST